MSCIILIDGLLLSCTVGFGSRLSGMVTTTATRTSHQSLQNKANTPSSDGRYNGYFGRGTTSIMHYRNINLCIIHTKITGKKIIPYILSLLKGLLVNLQNLIISFAWNMDQEFVFL